MNIRTTISLLAFWPLLHACAVKEEFEPYDSAAEYQQFIGEFNNEYRDFYHATRIALKTIEAAGDLAKVKENAEALARALEGGGENWPAPLDAWAAELQTPAESRAAVRAELASVAKAASAEGAEFAELLELAREKAGELHFPGFFREATMADLPADLPWVTNLDAPEVGSPEATKGGTFRQMLLSFPPTLRVTGNDSNNGFRSEHYDNVEMSPVEMHPDTGELIPGIADRWAVGEDERTVYYHIDPEATFSDGKPITTDDFKFTFYVQLNRYSENTYAHQYYREQFAHFTRYSERVYSVTLRKKKPLAPAFAGIYPLHSGFFSEIAPDFDKRYDWRCRPTTGAYELRPEGINKGRSITLYRVENWWARDKRYRRHRFNADRIQHNIIRDLPKAWELFRAGELDTFVLTIPEYWYERSEVPEVFKGYIERHTFYNVWPSSGSGLYLNTAKSPLDNKDVRIGISYAMDWEKVIQVIFRGDAKRGAALHEGYVLIKDPPVPLRPYDPVKARERFAAAGFTIPDADGILKNAAGERLSVSVTTMQVGIRIAIINLLAEQAKKAGLEIKIDAMEGTGAFQKVSQKQHQIGYNAWGFSPPINDYYQFLHSSNAYEKNGRLKTNTNNLFSYANPEMDALCDAHRVATSMEELSRLTAKIEQIMHDDAIYIPGARSHFLREAHWRWIRWPENYAVASCYISFDSYVWWIDERIKAETLAARASGQKFPEVMSVHDAYRDGPPPAGQPEPAPPPPQPLPKS
jgi:microcin C transport system substrate-binding protein